MTDYLVLPAGISREPSPSLARSKGRLLNTIMEERDEDISPRQAAGPKRAQHKASELKIEQWLSPRSDHFPTPRGFNFLAAPILPSSPSAASGEESTSPSSSSNPSNPWNRTSIMTDATEFDDLYDDVSEDEEETRKQKMQAALRGQNAARASPEESRKALPPLVIPTSRDAANEALSGLSARAAEWKRLVSPVGLTPRNEVPMSPEMMTFMSVQQSMEIPTISAPPSLDGSLTSDQMAQMSAPPTPVIGSKDDDDQDWSGVQLQPEALATLHVLSATSSPGSDIGFGDQVLELPLPVEQPAEEMAEVRRRPTLVLADIRNRSNDQPAPTEMTETTIAETLRQRPRLITNLARATMMLSPTHGRSLANLTKLDIPSPGGFFSGLSPRTRHTWHMPSQTPVDETGPPTSGTAERFYRLPWDKDAAPPLPSAPVQRPLHMDSGNFSSLPVEQVVIAKEKEAEKEDPDTAILDQPTPKPNPVRRVPQTEGTPSSAAVVESSSPVENVIAIEIVDRHDAAHAHRQQVVALSHLDRTEQWLLAQRAYLKVIGLDEPEQEEEEEESQVAEEKVEEPPPPTPPPKDHEVEKGQVKEPECGITRKKTVRFSADVKSPTVPRSLPSKLLHLESAYYRAFTDFIVRSQGTDVFMGRLPRFEALQAQRISLPDAHRSQLLGKYQLSVVPQSAKKRMSANVVRGDDVLIDDPAKLRADKEADALNQMAMSTWHVAAWKLLNGGRLMALPVHKRLVRLNRMTPGRNGYTRDRARILDLGGQATCDWAWHAALAYPNTKIYTVTTKTIRQLSNSNIRGPPNHRQVAVERLTKLPFASDQFDLIRAAELHSILKFVGENGQDEWESCLHECLRVLKPGGYLEFTVMDADMMNAGKLGNAKGVEFGFALKTLGYDPAPTKLFLNRLQRAGFEGTRRAWLSLPVGPKPAAMAKSLLPVARDANGAPVQTLELEAMVMGSADHVAAVTGIAAGWSWERWLLRAEMERAAGELRLSDIVTPGEAMQEAGKALEGVHAMIEEGRACGAGFRVLKGFTRKPRPGNDRMGLIGMVLDTGRL